MASLFPAGPVLPEFKSLIVKGLYHPSAPIHLALSHCDKFPNGTRVLIVAPSRETTVTALQEHNDDWMSLHAGTGNTLRLASCTTVYYPPSPAHLAYLFSMLTTDVQRIQNPATILDQTPSLVILLELSAYFLPDVHSNPTGHPWTLASYMTLVIRVFASFASLSLPESGPIALALFDSHLDELKLPIVKNPTPGTNKKPSKPENVAFFIQKYFEMVAVFEQDDDFFVSPSQDEEDEIMDAQRRNRIKIYHRGETHPSETRRWTERPSGNSGGIVFIHD
ncbi:hypothetical protein R3P38DRAFT_3386287 [Favolaschia claudopus]|uniref:Uncharacterized protein n=1 Tax=Favolaschia claudopus TaxID=2862362 RepID=A0AAW0DRE8_9AGAR